MKEPVLPVKAIWKLCFVFLMILLSASSLRAQETRKSLGTVVKTTEISIQIKGLHEKTSVTDLENVLRGYPGKIINHVIDKPNDAVTVLISDKMSRVDLLQVLEQNNFQAAYLDENNRYVSLDPADEEEVGEPENIK